MSLEATYIELPDHSDSWLIRVMASRVKDGNRTTFYPVINDDIEVLPRRVFDERRIDQDGSCHLIPQIILGNVVSRIGSHEFCDWTAYGTNLVQIGRIK